MHRKQLVFIDHYLNAIFVPLILKDPLNNIFIDLLSILSAI